MSSYVMSNHIQRNIQLSTLSLTIISNKIIEFQCTIRFFLQNRIWHQIKWVSSHSTNLCETKVTISSGQLMESQKWHRKLFCVNRFWKITILRPNFRNKLFSKLCLSKNGVIKSWCPKLIFFQWKIFLERFRQFLT